MAGCQSLFVLQLAGMIITDGMNYSWTDWVVRQGGTHETQTAESLGAQVAQQAKSKNEGSDPGLALSRTV